MTRVWPFRAGGLVTGLLVAGALAFLQTLNDEKDLFSCLCALAVLAVATLISLVPALPKLRPNLLCLCSSCVFFSYVIVRAVTSPVAYVARLDLYCVLGALTLYGLTLTAFASSTRRIGLILGFLAFATVHVIVSVVQFGLGTNYELLLPSLAQVSSSTRAAGFYIDPDHLAGLLEVLGVLGLSITAWSRWPAWVRVFFGYLAAVCYFGLILTGSRGGYLSAAASLLLFCSLSFMTLRAASLTHLAKFGGGGLALFGLVLFASWFFINQNTGLRSQMNNIATPDRGRLDLWQAAVEQWKLQPVIGTGSGTYLYYGRQFCSPQMELDPVDVHNDYLALLSEYGLVGVAGFLLFFGTHFYRGLRSFSYLGPRRIASGSTLRSDRLAVNIGALCAIAAYVVHSAVDFNLHIPANALLLAFIFGLVANPGIEADESHKVTASTKSVVIALAVILLVQCARLLPGEYYSEQARAALRDEDPATAVECAEKALDYEKHNPNTFFYLGRALVSLGNQDDHVAERPALYQRALQAFAQAQLVAPLDGTYPLEMARVYDRLGRFDEAEKMLVLARQRDPRSETIKQLYQTHLERRKESESTR